MKRLVLTFAALSLMTSWASEVSAQQVAPADGVLPTDRSVLPIPEPQYPHSTVFDARNATPPPRFQVKAPAGAPNVLIVLIDDMGFGQSSAFGGPLRMPTVESLANDGLRYNEFHTTALCSPTRAALLSGRNHHMNNMGSITETATGFPGQTGQRPNSVASVAEMLRLNGYSTAAFGKNHETAAWEVSPSGPTDRWPTRQGFDKFYGFMGGETNQWAPLIYDGMTQVELPKDPNYHFMNDMTNHAIDWMQYQKSLTPDKPFFIYFAPGATHAPHHVPKEWIAKYKGRFDEGWDVMREQTLARQIKLGVVPAGTKLAPKPEAIKDWATLTADEKKLFARQMEVFAGFAEYADTEIGRLIDAIKATGQLDNTLIFYIVGDNGASAEGGMTGLFNEMTYFNGVQETVQDVLKHYDELGGPKTYGHYAAGWAVAGDTPFTWTKQVASSYGGTRNGMVVHWPKGITAKGEVRSQWHHVIDIAPTILEAAGLPEPKSVDGTPQTPIEGTSMVYTFADPKAESTHKTQYFEIFGNRAIYSDGWLAGTIHRAAWELKPRRPLEQDIWELYDTTTDFSLTNDLAARNPDKLKAMQDLFLQEAVKYSVLPIDDRTLERTNAALVGRPDLMAGRTSLTVHEGMIGMSENVFINTKNRSHTITADLDIPKNGANGVILAQAGRFGGWSLYVKDGKPTYTYNFLGLQRYTIAARQALPVGKTSLRFEFAYDGGGIGKGGTGTLVVNGKTVAAGRIDRTQGAIFSADEGADVGADEGTPVTEDYAVPFKFTGKIIQVTIELKDMKKADRDDAEQGRKAAALKRGLSD
ncbi:MAG: arylsulfatase [Xanthobacteraceae bacterium]|nr:arylsulfatase [Xanthobacteraceae bacterium]